MERNPLTELLRPHVEALKADAVNGNRAAQLVIRMYGLHCKSPGDPGAIGICEAAFHDWSKYKRRTIP